MDYLFWLDLDQKAMIETMVLETFSDLHPFFAEDKWFYMSWFYIGHCSQWYRVPWKSEKNQDHYRVLKEMRLSSCSLILGRTVGSRYVKNIKNVMASTST